MKYEKRTAQKKKCPLSSNSEQNDSKTIILANDTTKQQSFPKIKNSWT